MIELEVLYHGTKFKYIAEQILKEGFEPWTYFSWDLNNAIHMGGKYVFSVIFNKADLPDNWQVRCENHILPSRIIEVLKYEKPERLFLNKARRDDVFANALEFPQKEYCFKEKNRNDKTT